jgi:hypothetical protein
VTELPKNWDALSLNALWSNLNDPRRHATPQSTMEAILHSVRSRGLVALEEADNKERLSRCDKAAMKQIHDRIKKMRDKGIVK